MQFHARTYDLQTGAITEQRLSGVDLADVEAALTARGLTVLSIARSGPRWRLAARRPFLVPLFCAELRTLLSSGMSLIEAIDTLAEKNDDAQNMRVLQQLRQHLLEGKPLSTAMEQNQFAFPLLLVASIRASERSSRVADALDEYIGYEHIGSELRRKVVSAAIYPALVIGFGFLVTLFMMGYVVPRFAKVYDDFAQPLSWSTQTLMQVGRFAGDHFAALLAALALLLGATVALYRSGLLGRVVLALLNRLAVAKFYLRLFQLARIFQTMSMLLRGGYPLNEAVPLAQNLAFDPLLRAQMTRAHQRLLEGKRMSTAFTEQGLTDIVAQRLLEAGERSGDLALVMDIIGQTYRQQFTLFVERVTRLAEPILLMAVGVMIGAIIIMMYMPVFDLAGGI